jgi:AcrR family transcriptional regulator
MTSVKQELPLVDAPTRRERADRSRNRARVLAAAQSLFASRGLDSVRMEDVAAAAGVGVGTVYRGFTDRAGLVRALLDERERALQDELLRGAPPLGPGAPARDRLDAFLEALAAYVEDTFPYLAAAEAGGRARGPVYAGWRLHTAVLLREAAPGADADWLADALLAPLAADLYRHQRQALGYSPERIRDGVLALAEAVTLRASAAAPRSGASRREPG